MFDLIDAKDYLRSKIKKNPNKKYVSFVSAGIACNALVVIDKNGILNYIKDQGYFDQTELNDSEKYKNPIALRAALLSLCVAEVLSKRENKFFLTNLGIELVDNMGLVSMLFEGYSDTISHQISLSKGEIPFQLGFINGGAIAEASIKFGENTVDPLIVQLIKQIKPNGTICDLGCGSGDRLLKLCKVTNKKGLGFDSSKEAIKISEKILRECSSIKIEEANITELACVHEDVEILMLNFVAHDLVPSESCAKILYSYQKNFPNMKYFFIVDIVSPCNEISTYMPGFDYIHGLQGIETRNHHQTMEVFEKSNYEVVNEFLIDKMPNTFLWVLKPKTS